MKTKRSNDQKNRKQEFGGETPPSPSSGEDTAHAEAPFMGPPDLDTVGVSQKPQGSPPLSAGTPPAVEISNRTRPSGDASVVVEHLRLVHFSILGFCLVVFLALDSLSQSSLARAGSSVREILGLEPVFSARGDILDEGLYWGWSEQKWLRDLVRANYGSSLPSGQLKFAVFDPPTNSRLRVEVAEQFRWFVRFSKPKPIVEKALRTWTVQEWAQFWDTMRDARLVVLPELGEFPSIYGYISSGGIPPRLPNVGWRFLKVVPGEENDDGWRAFLTDEPDPQHTFVGTTEDDSIKSRPYLDWYASGGRPSDYDISILKPYARSSWIDVQGMLAAKASAKWPRGTFAFTFPDLAEATRGVTTLTLADLPDELRRKEQIAGETLKVSGVELRSSSLGFWGIIVLLSLQLYFLLHLSALRGRLNVDDKGWSFPWIVLYRTALAFFVSTITLCAAPITVCIRLLLKAGLPNCSDVSVIQCNTAHYIAALLSVALAVTTFVHLYGGFRPTSWFSNSKIAGQ